MLREAGAARWFIAGVVALALIGSIATIVFALELSAFVARAAWADLGIAIVAAGVKALTLVIQESFAANAAAKVKAQLRRKLFLKLFESKSAWRDQQKSAELTWLLTSGLDSLDAYFAKFLPQLVYTALAMPLFVVVIGSQDWLSAGLLLVTMPLIPVFMVVIGWATARVQDRQLKALSSLSNYFGEIIRGLLTLRVYGRAEHQATNLVTLSKSHRTKTMKVLSVSFLSGFALELIASLSVALIAVSIGLRLLNGQMDYRVGLFVLLLAPDAYLPLRMIGANFHASSEGVAAIRMCFDLFDSEHEALVAQPIDFKVGKFTVLTGESGSGKSSALEALISDQTAWMPQATSLLPGTVEQNIAGFGVVDRIMLHEATTLACLDDVSLNSELSEINTALSGGQAQRVALARTFYCLLVTGRSTLLLDEPISAQDALRAKQIVRNLSSLSKRGFTVIANSHQVLLTRAADRIIEVSA